MTVGVLIKSPTICQRTENRFQGKLLYFFILFVNVYKHVYPHFGNLIDDFGHWSYLITAYVDNRLSLICVLLFQLLLM